jgi:hypothetical protein
MGEADDDQLHAEYLDVRTRLILAPQAGTFAPHRALSSPPPARVAAGDEIGIVLQLGEQHAVRSCFTGLLQGLLVFPGERVRSLQPVAWMTTDDALGATA